MYNVLSKEIEKKIIDDRKNGVKNRLFSLDENAIRRKNNEHDKANIIRSNYIRDIDKIMNCPYFTRYQDKTQVFSFYKNDDISHRSQHVQFVSRIARTIGKALNLNTELIEAIALGHDIGHTPFGHIGEKILDDILFSKSKIHFYHNVQSVRVLDKIFPLNISLQTLDGILCHNGEIELEKYRPNLLYSFKTFDKKIENCYNNIEYNKKLIPCTLEGCIVRISDIIAYLGKDRQDAEIINAVNLNEFTKDSKIGLFNAEIINNISNNIIENSYGKDYIKIDNEYFSALKNAKNENYEKIYLSNSETLEIQDSIRQMMVLMFDRFIDDFDSKNKKSFIYTHHIDYINSKPYKRSFDYQNDNKYLIVADYIASMTDDYFVEIFNNLYPCNKLNLKYKDYF